MANHSVNFPEDTYKTANPSIDLNGTPVLCLNESDARLSVNDGRCSLHVQLEQCGQRTPQCTLQGNLDKPEDRMALRKLSSAWKKRFIEEVEESCIYVIDVERVLQNRRLC